MLYFLAYSGLISGISALIFGLFVYFKNRHNVINQSYGILSLCLVLWGVPYFFWPLAKTKEQAFISFQLLHVGAILVAPTYLWFIFALLNIHKKFKKLIISESGVALFLLFFIPTPLFIKDMVPQYIFHYWAVPGVMYHFFLLFWFSCIFFVWLHLGIHYHRSVGSRKNQLKYVLIGTVLGILGGATNYLPWYKIYIPPVGTILVAVHVAIFAYAIAKFRLMDIRIAITRTGIFVGVYALVLGLPFILATSGKNILIGLLGPAWWLGPLVLMATLGTVGPFIYLYLKRSVEAILLREQFRYKKILSQAAEEMAHIFGLKKLLDFMAHVLTASVRISHAAIYLYNTEGRQFLLNTARNIKSGLPQAIGKESLLIDWLESQKMPLVYEEVKRHVQERQVADFDFEEIEKALRALQASVVIPSLLEDRLLGFIVLGDKRSGRIYANEDLSTLLVLGSQFALAVENASLYNNLEEQVSQRTKELIDMQKQLIQAEKLASVGTLAGGVAHEINNPLAAILTNVQMLLADSNTADEDTKESLELIEEATKRCRTIVQKLMAYAKKPLETTEFTEVNLLKAVKNVISFLGYQFEQENVKFSVNANEDNYWVKGNQNEIEQLVTNIVLNARDAIKRIKKSGVIQIDLVKNEKWITTEIKDEGAGISKEIIPKIFDPFFTTKDVGKGLGLGLSICQAIAERHNGKINVKSEVNRGSTFIVQLPRAKVGSRIESEVGSQRKLES